MCVRRAAETALMCSVSCASSVDGHRAWRLELPICSAHTKPVAKSVSNSNPWGARQPAMIRKPTASARPATLAPAAAHRTAGTRPRLNEDRQHADHALGGSGVWTSPRRVTSCTVTSRRCSRTNLAGGAKIKLLRLRADLSSYTRSVPVARSRTGPVVVSRCCARTHRRN